MKIFWDRPTTLLAAFLEESDVKVEVPECDLTEMFFDYNTPRYERDKIGEVVEIF